MAENEEGQERTEQATPRRLQKAKEKGQVARSRELTTMGVLMVASAGLISLGGGMLEDLSRIMERGFTLSRAQIMDDRVVFSMFNEMLLDGVLALVPFFALVMVAALLAPMLLGGWSFAVSAFAFKWEKLDPIKGLKRVFSMRGLMELAKALAKFILVAGVGIALIWTQLDSFLGLGQQPVVPALQDAGWLLGRSILILSSTLILIAAVDVPFQLWDHAKQLRMTRQELKDEYKETEGKPEVKSRIRELQQEVAQRRMMEEVPKADVIVTNPTHFSVALRYDQENMAAPIVVAKGADLVAMRIRQVGEENGVPLVSVPLLARALYFHTDLEQEIPAQLYLAVAQVLAYVFQLKSYSNNGGLKPEVPPVDGMDVPEEYRVDPRGRPITDE